MLCWWCQVRMVSSPELLNKYVGESENNLRALFYQAEMDAEQLGSDRYVYPSITFQTVDTSLETLFNIVVMWLLLLNTLYLYLSHCMTRANTKHFAIFPFDNQYKNSFFVVILASCIPYANASHPISFGASFLIKHLIDKVIMSWHWRFWHRKHCIW